jgi:hypothetical protein
MDQNLLLLVSGAIILNCIILYLVISFATKADRRARYEWAQLELLSKIARAQGVPEEEIVATFKAIN